MKSPSLVLPILCFFMGSACRAALPFLWMPSNTPDTYKTRFNEAWKEAMVLARAAALTFEGPCDPVYQRYFEDEGASLVKHIFQTIANIPPDAQYDKNNIQDLLENEDIMGLSPKFSKMTLALRVPPNTPETWKDYCTRAKGSGAMIFDQMKESATVILCDGVLVYPLESEIYNPPAWARDEDGTPLEGYGCDGLGGREWTQFIQPSPKSGNRLILDFWAVGTNPTSGYGAYNTQLLKQRVLEKPSDFGAFPTLNNADTYLWYALSKYWSWACGKSFAAARSPEDDDLRHNDGGVLQPPPEGEASDQPLAGSGDVVDELAV
ncbi:hypothetical protein H2200_005309 [Cladophialophora chaetospira]|uniref:Uncharacterized protein n=1 Tax=Cladophialophora chaetospira TaxID=386627 RepID=A0AA39CJH0_9EURO|nr:hypothetical protein H2200_005309 [Cladophialophora chaetospira]